MDFTRRESFHEKLKLPHEVEYIREVEDDEVVEAGPVTPEAPRHIEATLHLSQCDQSNNHCKSQFSRLRITAVEPPRKELRALHEAASGHHDGSHYLDDAKSYRETIRAADAESPGDVSLSNPDSSFYPPRKLH